MFKDTLTLTFMKFKILFPKNMMCRSKIYAEYSSLEGSDVYNECYVVVQVGTN